MVREIYRGGKIVISPYSTKSVSILDATDRKVASLNMVLTYDRKNKKFNITNMSVDEEYTYIPKELVKVYYPNLNSEIDDVLVVNKNKREKYSKMYEIQGEVEIRPRADLVISKSEQKEEMKVYETPYKVIAKFMEDVIDLYRGYVLRNIGTNIEYVNVFKSLKLEEANMLLDIVEDSKNIEDFYSKIPTLPNNLKKMAVDLFGEEENYKKLKKSAKSLKDTLSVYHKVKTIDHREFFPYIEKNWEKIKDSLKRLKEPPKVVIYDPQAGSGEAILRAFDEYNVPGKLVGTEIRDIRNSDNRYNVLTKTDSILFSDIILRKIEVGQFDDIDIDGLNSRERNQAIRGIFAGIRFINPPYDTRHIYVSETLKNYWEIFTNSKTYKGITFGLLSHSHQDKLEDVGLEGRVYKVSVEDTGYEGNNIPEKFLYVRGIYYNLRGNFRGNIKVKEEKLNNLQNVELDVAGDMIPEIDRIIEEATISYNYVEQINTSLKKVYESYLNSLPKTKEELFNKYSLKTKALKGEPVFPALNFVKGGFLTFEEVRLNSELLNIYRDYFPDLYKLFLEVGKEKGYTIKEIEKEEENYSAIPYENLGIMKYKYLPFIVPVNEDVKNVLKELIEKRVEIKDEERNNALSIVENIDDAFVWIKSDLQPVYTGNVGYGYVSKLTLSEKTGKTIAVLEVDIKEFYEKCIERGIVKPNVRHISEHPKYKDVLYRILDVFSKENKEIDNIFTKEEMEYIDKRTKEERGKGKSIKDTINIVSAEIYKKWREEGKVLTDRILNVNVIKDAHSTVYSKLKAMNVDEDKIKEVLKELQNLDKIYVKNHVKFLENLISVNEDVRVDELEGTSVKEYLEDRLSKIIQDKNIVSEVVQDVVSAYVNLSQIDISGIYSTAKLIYTYLYAEYIQSFLQKGDIDNAYKLFEDLHINKLGLKPHQFYVPLNTVILSELTDIKKAVYGWEMRTGKTLASVFHLYLNSLLDKEQRAGMFEVRSANVFDIANQILNFLPYIGTKMAVFPNEADTNIKQKFSVLTDECIPNVFFNTKLFKGKGSTVEKLLQDNPFLYIEEKANDLTNEDMKDIEKRAKGKVFEKLLYVPEFKKEYLYAVVDYLLSKEDYIEKNTKEWDKFIQNLGKYAEGIKDIKDINMRDYRLLLVSKDTHHLRFNYKLEFSQKLLSSFSNNSIYSNADTKLKVVGLSKDVPDYNYYVVDIKGLIKWADEEEQEDLMSNIIHIGNISDVQLGLIDKVKLFEYNLKITEQSIIGNYTFKDLPVMTLHTFANSLIDKKGIKRCLGLQDNVINGNLTFPIPFPIVKREKKQVVYLYPEDTEGLITTNVRISSDNEKVGKVITYEYDTKNPKVKPIIETTKTNKSPIIYSLNTPNMFSCVNKDEADQSSNVFSTDNKITSYISQTTGKTAIVSGTLTSGDISSLVSFLSIGGKIEDVAKLTNIAGVYFDIYEISDNFGSVFKVLMEYVLRNKDDEKELEKISKVLTFEDYKHILSFLESLDIPYSDQVNIRNYTLLLEKNSKERLKFTNVLNTISDKLVKLNSFNGEIFIKVVADALKEKGLLRKGIGTTNLSFVKIIPSDVSSSLLISEDLTGIKRVIERDEIEENTYENIKLYFKTRDLSHVKGYIENFTIGEIRPASAIDVRVIKTLFDNPNSLKDLVIISNNEEYSELYTSYKTFMQVVKAVQKELLNEDEFIGLVSKSGKTTQDSLYDLVRETLIGSNISEGEEEEIEEELQQETEEDIKELAEENIKIEDKKQFADEVIQAIQNMDYTIDLEDSAIIFKLNVRGKEINVKDSLSLYDENVKEYIEKATKYRYKATIDLFAGRPVEEDIFTDRNSYYNFDYNLIESKDKEVIETVLNKGLLLNVNKKIEEGKSFAILPSRVHLSNVAIADVLSGVLRQKRENNLRKPVQVIIRITDKKIKEFVSRLNVEALREKGIIVKAYNNQALIDAELLSLKDKNIKDKVQTILISPAQSTSRGVDLSMLDGIIFYGILANSREFMQAIQRLYSPSKFIEEDGIKVSKANVTLYGTGFINYKDKVIPTYTNITAYRNEEKKKFSDAVMSGSLSPVIDKSKIVSYVNEEFNINIQQKEDLSLRVA